MRSSSHIRSPHNSPPGMFRRSYRKPPVKQSKVLPRCFRTSWSSPPRCRLRLSVTDSERGLVRTSVWEKGTIRHNQYRSSRHSRSCRRNHNHHHLKDAQTSSRHVCGGKLAYHERRTITADIIVTVRVIITVFIVIATPVICEIGDRSRASQSRENRMREQPQRRTYCRS